MSSYFFRVEHDLLRSEAFKRLGGSAIKVYLVLGLYSDFGTDWAYPSIRTIARQAGLSRQTVLAAIDQLVELGLLATTKSKGRSTAYRLIRPAPARPTKKNAPKKPMSQPQTGQFFLEVDQKTVPESLEVHGFSGPKTGPELVQDVGSSGLGDRPKRETSPSREATSAIPLTGTPFLVTASGDLVAASELRGALIQLGLSPGVASDLLERHEPEQLARIVLNALHLQAQGKLRNPIGYIRSAIAGGYELLPQVAARVEGRRRDLATALRQQQELQARSQAERAQEEEKAAIAYVLERLSSEELERLLQQALEALPDAIARRNPTLSNPFVRAKVYELACGEPSP